MLLVEPQNNTIQNSKNDKSDQVSEKLAKKRAAAAERARDEARERMSKDGLGYRFIEGTGMGTEIAEPDDTVTQPEDINSKWLCAFAIFHKLRLCISLADFGQFDFLGWYKRKRSRVDSDADNLSNTSSTSRHSTTSILSITSVAISKVKKTMGKAAKNVVSKVKQQRKSTLSETQSTSEQPIEISDNESFVNNEDDEHELERLKACWTSPIYSFFHETPTIAYEGDRKYHFFRCKASSCRSKGEKGVRCQL
ncbi:hypothetical protein K435DRAFT_809697 [Dendrothele bispora CBS 962.96]|uniref:Uncharacterized protein n=1 Tax=Dendrothele bispora (strain CBS 962.96) TaxID=1314807 RepID=A0A4V4HBT3_DENBC|nr:hypothetical protein K435DRAFT_809697 [Dendrothele bispora CBS 962.96]